MPAAGRKPNEGQPVRHRHQPTHSWTEVEALAFEDPPALTGRWSQAVLEWWGAISTMPHCILWDASDWQFAKDTARIAKAFYRGNIKAATELRQREKVMGTTVDSRRDLRIRYVEHVESDTAPAIASIEDYFKESE